MPQRAERLWALVTSDRTPFIRGSSIGGPTPFTLEAQLVEPVTAWLEGTGHRVEPEVPILGRRADLIGTRDDALVAVELKLRDWGEALRQAIAYQLAADRAWVAMPLAAASSAYRQRWRFEAEGVGLLAVDDRRNVRAPIPAGPSPRLLPYLRERVLAGSVARSWEFSQAVLPSGPEFASVPDSSDL
jgi:hypothetical protein